ncbi:MAG: aminotransferase class I/II-fold pyridoxal phosphate-dependent enzyme [Halobacteria archaeon]|nr:aminotransferase class I/II-fold pyridoxal phosphate-dependent enzyme [Halobacteria archaeon]
MTEASRAEKGGVGEGIRLLLCENPLPPIDEAVSAARKELPRSNRYTEPYSEPLRRLISHEIGVPEKNIHINAGSELILRQIFDRYVEKSHLITPTYHLFREISPDYTETRLSPEEEFEYDLGDLDFDSNTDLVVVVSPNNPNGGSFNVSEIPDLLEENPDTYFLVDEAFFEFTRETVADLVPDYSNLIVTRTFSKAHSLAGFRVGYVVAPEAIADELNANANNDAYPLSRAGEAAAVASLRNKQKIYDRADRLRSWTRDLSESLSEMGVETYPTDTGGQK